MFISPEIYKDDEFSNLPAIIAFIWFPRQSFFFPKSEANELICDSNLYRETGISSGNIVYLL